MYYTPVMLGQRMRRQWRALKKLCKNIHIHIYIYIYILYVLYSCNARSEDAKAMARP